MTIEHIIAYMQTFFTSIQPIFLIYIGLALLSFAFYVLFKGKILDNTTKKIKRVFNNVVILVTLSSLFILAHLVFPLKTLAAVSDNFNKVAIGIAALITTYFGSSYLREELSRKRSIEYFRKKYPPEKYKKTYKIIASKDDPGAVFLYDMESLLKHHIWNMKTMYDLGWQIYERELLPKEEFLSYLSGNAIRTRGDLGE